MGGITFAATKATGLETAPTADQPLLPPHGELIPTFWEQHGWIVLVDAEIIVLLAAWLAYLLLRPKRLAPETPVMTARRQLHILKDREETGALVMEVSTILKRYLNPTLSLLPGEKTTTEMCAALAIQSTLPEELVPELTGFLKRCDEWKFSPSPRPDHLGVVESASKLIDSVEAALEKVNEAKIVEALNP